MAAKLWTSRKEECSFLAKLFLELLPGSPIRVLRFYLEAFEKSRRLAGLTYRELGTSRKAIDKFRAKAARCPARRQEGR